MLEPGTCSSASSLSPGEELQGSRDWQCGAAGCHRLQSWKKGVFMLFCPPVEVYSQSCTTMSEVFGWPGGGGRELVAGGEVMPASLPVLCLQLQDEDIKDYFEKHIKTTVTEVWCVLPGNCRGAAVISRHPCYQSG